MSFGFGLLLAIPLAYGRLHGGAQCSSIEDCSLAGECVGGTCICDVWAAADDCSQLNMREAKPGHVRVYPEDGWSSWGAQVIHINGTYHMYSARMGNSCGLNSWWCNSEVVHAESQQPDGPFTTKETVMLPFAHNPAVARAADGTIVIYHIGDGANPPQKQVNCSGGISRGTPDDIKPVCGATSTFHAAPQAGDLLKEPNFASSKSPDGPWQHSIGNSNWGADNPAPVFLDNGTVLVYAKYPCNVTLNPAGRGQCYQYGLMSAPHWRGPWTFVRRIEIFGEDVVAWQDKRGHFHMILQGGPYKNTTSPHLQTCQGHMHTAWSRDGLEWTMNCQANGYEMYPNFPLTNGSTWKVTRRERQFVLLSDQKEPLWWYSSVAGLDYDKWAGVDPTYSTAQPFNTEDAERNERQAASQTLV